MIRVKLIALLALLTVALLNPLACLLHCELLQAASGDSPAGSAEFLCHGLLLPTLETAVGPASVITEPPRAVYAATLGLILLLLALAAAGRHQPGLVVLTRRRMPDAPPVPPPRRPLLRLS